MFAKFFYLIQTQEISSPWSQILQHMGMSSLCELPAQAQITATNFSFSLFLVFTLHLGEKYTYIPWKSCYLGLNKLPSSSCCIPRLSLSW